MRWSFATDCHSASTFNKPAVWGTELCAHFKISLSSSTSVWFWKILRLWRFFLRLHFIRAGMFCAAGQQNWIAIIIIPTQRRCVTGVTHNTLHEAVGDRTGLALLEKQTTKNAARWEVNPKNSNLPLCANDGTLSHQHDPFVNTTSCPCTATSQSAVLNRSLAMGTPSRDRVPVTSCSLWPGWKQHMTGLP